VFLKSLSEGLSARSGEFCIFTARNGEEALRILDSTPVDLVVTDLKMPVMDGFEFLWKMRNTHPDIPVMVMSAFLNDDVDRRLATLGVSRYLEKPLDFEDFARSLRDEPPVRRRESNQSIPLP
jgi:YesN/AraC family two-component response regulator